MACSNPECQSLSQCSISQLPAALAGYDQRLEHKEIYPGSAELYLALATGPKFSPEYVPLRPILFSARPREAGALLAIKQGGKLPAWYQTVAKTRNYSWWGLNLDGSQYGAVADSASSEEAMRFRNYGKTKVRVACWHAKATFLVPRRFFR